MPGEGPTPPPALPPKGILWGWWRDVSRALDRLSGLLQPFLIGFLLLLLDALSTAGGVAEH